MDRIAETEAALEKGDEFFDPDLLRAVRDSINLEVWLKSPVGLHTYNKAVREIRENTALILNGDSLKTPEAEAAHTRIKVLTALMEWFDETLQEGRKAQQQLENEHGQEAREIDGAGGFPDEY